MKLEIISRVPEVKNGQPILFVHGAWHAAWCWDEFFMPFFSERGYPCYALSLRGHGKSEGEIKGAKITDYLADLEKAVAEIGQPLTLVGHSLGGYLVQRYLEKHKAQGAVLLAAMPPSKYSFFVRVASFPFFKALSSYFRNRPIPPPSKIEQVRRFFFSSTLPLSTVESYQRKMGPESLAILIDYLITKPPAPEKIKQTPIIIINGADDRKPKSNCSELVSGLYNAEFQVFENTAHNIMLESSWEPVAKRILVWLDQLNSPKG